MDAYEKYLKDEEELAKPKFTNNQLFIGGLIILILILGVYIYTELPTQDVEVIRNESLILGYSAGVEQWNAQVISAINEYDVVLYIENNLTKWINISNCVGVQNDN